ncbi:TetR/AcrR family transcriptional regulator [Melghirimyces algeriensis]|uniref:Transcriptional regulator, TetR family n=1 Tax=Melghirimyces algeriensis TaxID=910412 RepID=A0A521D198_9BACL|nr:TetR/AcrR family transcriptional regulator [Melghirimyces algeriensis]SMO65432.1 transcriptional regulator, TetR family [Melghirimyces algeriensis]
MPRSPEQNRAIREKRKKQIYEAALGVYRERGYYGAEMGAIARRAGLGRGLIYYYFKDKQDLFISLIRFTLLHWKERLDDILLSGEPVADRLELIMKSFYSLSHAFPDISYFHQTVSRDVKVLFPERESEVYELYEQYILKPVRMLMKEGVDRGEISIPPELGERFFFRLLFEAVHHENMIEEKELDQWVKTALYGLVNHKKNDSQSVDDTPIEGTTKTKC